MTAIRASLSRDVPVYPTPLPDYPRCSFHLPAEGIGSRWVGLGACFFTEMVYHKAVTHLDTNQARRRVTYRFWPTVSLPSCKTSLSIFKTLLNDNTNLIISNISLFQHFLVQLWHSSNPSCSVAINEWHKGEMWQMVANETNIHSIHYLWSPCVIGNTIYIFIMSFVLLSFFLSSPNLSGRRLDVCHTSTHGVALVRI